MRQVLVLCSSFYPWGKQGWRITKFFQDHTMWTWQTQNLCPSHFVPCTLDIRLYFPLYYTLPLYQLLLYLSYQFVNWLRIGIPYFTTCPQQVEREKRREKNYLLYFSFWKRNSPKHLELTFYPNTSSSIRLVFHWILFYLFQSNHSY